MISVRGAIIWGIVILILGGILGFGLRAPIAGTLNLEAQNPGFPNVNLNIPRATQDEIDCIRRGGIWTGNGCAKPWTWTPGDWSFFQTCIASALQNPPPALPDKGVTESEYISCVRQTESGKGRR